MKGFRVFFFSCFSFVVKMEGRLWQYKFTNLSFKTICILTTEKKVCKVKVVNTRFSFLPKATSQVSRSDY